MSDEEETSIAQNVPELSLKCLSLTNSMKLNVNNKEIIEDHLNTYAHKHPLTPLSFNDIDLEWFNVSEHLSVQKHLSTRIVVVDFFTYCCINCLHILPDLKALEEKYDSDKSPVVVVGIHSAKFTNEKQTKNVFEAIKKNGITHPVANDVNCKLWHNLGISCWPTLLILGPGAVPFYVLVGEGHRNTLFQVVDQAVEYFSNKGHLKTNKLPLNPSVFLPSKESDLQYPGKVSCYSEGLIIADSGNNRIILMNYEGEISIIIGSGRRGFDDGSFEEASFNDPQGVTFHPSGIIFVADTRNHSIREIDLKNGFVRTIAGTGYQGQDKSGGLFGVEQELSSPWDVCLSHTVDVDRGTAPPNLLLVAMAGSHQIWGMFLTNGQWLKRCCYRKGAVVCLAGSGAEENRNTSYPLKAGFAQPSGICVSSTNLQTSFIADSESSSIRQFSLDNGEVKRVVGGAVDPTELFAYGDCDGEGIEARLQHALGVTTDDNVVYVADSYNNKVKKVIKMGKKFKLETLEYSTEDDVKLNEPGGLEYCESRNSLFIANTNDGSILELNLTTNNMRKLIMSSSDNTSAHTEDTVDSKGDEFTLKFVPEGKSEVNFHLVVEPSDGFHVTPTAKHSYQIVTNCNNVKGSFIGTETKVPVTFDMSGSCEQMCAVKCALKLCSDEGHCLVEELYQRYKFVKDPTINSAKINTINVTFKPNT